LDRPYQPSAYIAHPPSTKNLEYAAKEADQATCCMGIRRTTRGTKTGDANEQQAEPKDSDDETPINVIYYQQSLPISGSTHNEITDEVLKHVNSVEDLNVLQIGQDENSTTGNQEGLNFLEETTANLKQCHEERTSMKDGLEDHGFEIAQMKEQVRILQAQSQDRNMLRMRFLSTFKRDHLPQEYNITHRDAECIKEGNSQAHDPDPVGDAELYFFSSTGPVKF
jgi:hypothetical protein